MYDGIKIEASIFDKKKWNNSLELVGRHSENTGEVLPLPSDCTINNLTFSRIAGKFKTHHNIQGSLHRYYRYGLENDNDYTLSQVHDTISRLRDEHGINPKKSKVINFEFGVNIELPKGNDAQVFQKYLVSAYSKAFEKLNPKRPMVGYIAEFNEFSIKVYDKGYHAQTGATNLLRVEIKINRSRWLDQFNFIKGDDLLLTDLLNPVNINILGDILSQKIRSLIVTPRDLDIKKLLPKQKLTYYECRDARSWEDWSSKQRERKRQQLAHIFETLNQPNPIDVLAKLVEDKWRELTTMPTVPEVQKPIEKVSLSTLIVDGIRVIMSLLIIRDYVCTYRECQYMVYQPRGIPIVPTVTAQPVTPGYRRWIDLNIRSPTIQSCWELTTPGMITLIRMKKKQKDEPVWMKMFRNEILKPKEKVRHTEQKGRTEASQAGFYNTKAWQKIRDQRRRMNPLCQMCEARGYYNAMKTVDHIITVEEAPHLALDINNTQSLCDFDHNIKTKQDAARKKELNRLKIGKQLMNKYETPGG